MAATEQQTRLASELSDMIKLRMEPIVPSQDSVFVYCTPSYDEHAEDWYFEFCISASPTGIDTEPLQLAGDVVVNE